MIYRIKNNFEDYYSFLLKNAELGSKMPNFSPRFQAKPRLNEWVIPNASFYASANYKNDKVVIPDMTTWLTGLLVLNQKAYSYLQAVLGDSGEFLPVSVEGAKYYAFNTLNVIPETAMDKSEAKPDPDVEHNLVGVKFDEASLGDHQVFKSSVDHLLHTFCTGSFKRTVEEIGLRGLVFEEWS